MVVGFITTWEISAYHHLSCEFESWSWWGVLDTTLCDQVCQWLAAGQWFSLGTPVSSTNKTDRHDIAEILLKVVLNTHNNNPNKETIILACCMVYGISMLFSARNCSVFFIQLNYVPYKC